jgi:plasmid replication initiation protein
MEPDKNGKKIWKEFTWFAVATFDEATGQATMKFSGELAEFLMALKWVYSKISLSDLGQLQSRYAIKLLEMALSYRSLAGKKGNRDGSWYFERGFPEEFRHIMGVGKDAYKDNHLLKQKVIDKPLKEINRAGFGLSIKPTTVKQGRRIVAVRFECAQAGRAAERKKHKSWEAAPLPPDGEALREEKELERLRERHPDEFAEIYQIELARVPAYIPDCLKLVAAESIALMELKNRHGAAK